MKYKAIYSNDKKGKDKEVELDWDYFATDDCIEIIIDKNKRFSMLKSDWDNLVEDINNGVN